MQEHIFEEEVESFELPPIGKSKKEDFNPMVHLEIESDEEEQEENDDPEMAKEGSQEDEDSDHS